jgi:hypothetical protein
MGKGVSGKRDGAIDRARKILVQEEIIKRTENISARIQRKS